MQSSKTKLGQIGTENVEASKDTEGKRGSATIASEKEFRSSLFKLEHMKLNLENFVLHLQKRIQQVSQKMKDRLPPSLIGESRCTFVQSAKTRSTTFPFNQADTIKVFSYVNPTELRQLLAQNPKGTNIKEEIILSESQTDRLFSIFYDFKQTGRSHVGAICYIPRHGIVFYEDAKVLAFYELCLACKTYSQTPNVDFGDLCSDKFYKFRDFFEQIGIQYGLGHSPYSD